MKKLLVLSVCLLSLISFSQEKETITNNLLEKNELKLNGLFLVLGAIEVDYQYLINDESGVGFDLFFSFDDETINVNYFLAPYYRQYFGKTPASGFFVEGFAMLNSTDDYFYSENYDPVTDTFTYNDGYQDNVVDFALGIGTGVKFLTKRGFVLEIDLGVGRNLFQNDRDYKIIGKGGINLGYRF